MNPLKSYTCIVQAVYTCCNIITYVKLQVTLNDL